MAVDPDGSAMEKVAHPATQGLYQRPRAGEPEGDHVDHDVGREFSYEIREGATGLLRRPVGDNVLHRIPGFVRTVRRRLAPGDIDDGVTGLDQTRHQIGADMSTSADDDDAHLASLLETQVSLTIP